MPNRANILYLVHRLPYPPDKGDRIRAYHMIRYLSQVSHIHLACLADEAIPPEAKSHLEQYCTRVAIVPQPRWKRLWGAASSMAIGRTATEGVFHSTKLHEAIRAWSHSTSFHAVIASSSGMVPYARHRDLTGVRAVVDLVDVDSQKWLECARVARGLKQWIFSLEAKRLRKVEQGLPLWAHAVTLISAPEAALYNSFARRGHVEVVTNGVDKNYFQSAENAAPTQGCVFVGALNYLPNVDAAQWFAKTVWPEIHKRNPQHTFKIVGRRPTGDVLSLKQIPGVEVIGQVPDVRPYLAQARFVVAPLRIARGLQNKVLEAMAMSKAVLASPQALEGLSTALPRPGVEAKSENEWIELACRLFADSQWTADLGKQSRAYIEKEYSWDKGLEPLLRILGIGPKGVDFGPHKNGHSAKCPAHAPPVQEIGL